jgi:hypothetical protein
MAALAIGGTVAIKCKTISLLMVTITTTDEADNIYIRANLSNDAGVNGVYFYIRRLLDFKTDINQSSYEYSYSYDPDTKKDAELIQLTVHIENDSVMKELLNYVQIQGGTLDIIKANIKELADIQY